MDMTLKEPRTANTKPSVQLWGHDREQNDLVFFPQEFLEWKSEREREIFLIYRKS